MFIYVFSIILVVASNLVYHICQKSTPSQINPLTALFVTYATGTLITFVATFFYRSNKSFLSSFKDLNWTSFVLGLSIVGLEMGYLLAYRAGWNISIGPLVANIILSLVLIPVGLFFYQEGMSPSKLLGAALCLIGLFIINKK